LQDFRGEDRLGHDTGFPLMANNIRVPSGFVKYNIPYPITAR
jgi:hypothetical protein